MYGSATPATGVALTYEDVIDTQLDNGFTSLSYTYEGGTPAWRNYEFYPASKGVVCSPRKRLFTLLEQKMLCYATEDGWQDKGSGTKNYIYFFRPTDARATDYTITDPLSTYSSRQEERQLIWRDEFGVDHSDGSATAARHNLGYVKTTATAPTNSITFSAGAVSSKLPVHLKRQTGDKVRIVINDNLTIPARRVEVVEVFDPKSVPSWYQIITTLEWFRGTEGGSVGEAITAAAPFLPLSTGSFRGILSESDNNLQTAMDTIDREYTGGS